MAKHEEHDDGTEKATAADVLRPVTKNDLKVILGARAQASEDRREINVNVRAKIEEVLGEKKFLDRMMLAPVEKLYHVEDNDVLADHLDNLFYMLDASGILARAQKANPRLDLPDQRKSAKEDKAEPAKNVTPLRGAAAPAAS